MTHYSPTDEQLAALDLFEAGDSMVIEAGAGTGKTSTLLLLAESTDRRGQYVAYNKAIVKDVERDLPDSVRANTAHSLAFGPVGKRYAHRLNGKRLTANQRARLLGLDKGFTVRLDEFETKRLEPWYLSGQVIKAIQKFATTDDATPSVWHFPYIDGIDAPDSNGKRTYDNNDRVREFLAPALHRAWADIQSRDGQLPFEHDYYLKMWQLADPRINADFILLDEAQDANPVIAAIIEAQGDRVQRVYVGDSQQQIYEFTGAVNAMAKFDTDHRTFLTQSFRFGDVIANTANLVLDQIPDAELRLRGFEEIDSIVDVLDAPSAVLTRTNGCSVNVVLEERDRGRSTHLVGGGGPIAAFARGAHELQVQGYTSYGELACFNSWGAVTDYVRNDPQGSELAASVKLIERYGIDTVLAALTANTPEDSADVVVSTAHKSKGRQWSSVRIADDFPTEIADAGELRLLYVAVTRAQHVLDDTSIAYHYRPGALPPPPPWEKEGWR